ncbi:MAG: ATP-binding cassette domain-containing protein [Promethearchaeota archaeon]
MVVLKNNERNVMELKMIALSKLQEENVMTRTTAIVVDNLSKSFGNIPAVDQISFDVNRGEIFGFLGPNGAGKTTTIRMLTGVLRPTSGSVNIFGIDVWENLLAIKQIIGNVPEMANVYMDLSAWDNLELTRRLFSIPKNIRHERSEKLLREFGLFEKRHVKTKKYSKGMKQRLLLCMALLSDPQILFLDEPTSGLDVNSARTIKTKLKSYCQENGKTIFLTTHNMQVAKELCNRIAIVKQGKIIRLDTPEMLCVSEELFPSIDIEFNESLTSKEFEGLQNHVKEIIYDGTTIRFYLNDFQEGINKIISHLYNNKIMIKKISTHEPSLEDVFVKLTNGGIINAE